MVEVKMVVMERNIRGGGDDGVVMMVVMVMMMVFLTKWSLEWSSEEFP